MSEVKPAGRLAGVRLLIVDDMADNADAMAELLRYEGAGVTTASNAQAAIEKTLDEMFDVIISDLAMPKMDGYTMLGKMREGTLNRTTPAIAYSGYGGSEEIARSLRAGFQRHLVKPVDFATLLVAIEELVKRPAAPPDAQSPSRLSAD